MKNLFICEMRSLPAFREENSKSIEKYQRPAGHTKKRGTQPAPLFLF